ncbi:MAG: hypothetical protein O2955_09905 [Planctomycetota bacterium]|nr:hypothetical protein [Planctomycetota bacterium]MDA1212824.1 hypothetical protein [Planctomycetota bacterium]
MSTTQSQAASQCVRIEIYVKDDCKECKPAKVELNKFAEKRAGVIVRTFNVDTEPKYAERLETIRKYFKVEKVTYPVVYGCNTFLQGFTPQKTVTQTVERMLTITAYVRAGCPHCAAAKRFLPGLMRRYPAFRLAQYDVVDDQQALSRMEAVVKRYRQSASSLPVIHLCNQLSIGYDTDATTGRRIESILKYWTSACPEANGNSSNRFSPFSDDLQFVDWNEGMFHIREAGPIIGIRFPIATWSGFPFLPLLADSEQDITFNTAIVPEKRNSSLNPLPPPPLEDDASLLPPPPMEDDEMAPLPPDVSGVPPSTSDEVTDVEDLYNPETMTVPLFGRLNPHDIGMPAFTVLIGLVDGFNPCAMWVLMFLLSLLVNLKSRAKILAVAGTFVFISGAAYFAFMAAWIQAWKWIGLLPWVQMTLGVFATFIGLVHVKDFFAYKKGISFSIPESAKPGIYERVRKIVTAENLTGAILGASVLAVLVNLIELLCTAGLPALYTQILTMQEYPPWKNYAMLGLYNLAYMFDDSLMVGIVVVTLGKHKLQEKQGRWLKLFSGLFILTLGVIMMVKPELLK